ncbi:MAG: VCBS repeat-containing protein [Treponema phagedenis]|uniref:VCBS repeat-containing protein n=1 Tax=Treponema phagedenis TaxID=162 RepID=UPI003133D550
MIMDYDDAEVTGSNKTVVIADSVPVSEESPAAERPTPSKTKKRKRSFFARLGIFLLVLLCIVFLPAAGLVLYSLIDRENPARYISGGYVTLVTVRSASDTLQKGLYLSAADSLLAAPETAALQGNIRSLRANTLLRSGWFTRLLNIPITAALYADNHAALISDIGIRSAVTRLLPLILRIKPDLFSAVQGLSQTSFDLHGKKRDGFICEISKKQSLYFSFYKNVLIAATSPELFYSCLDKNSEEAGKKLVAILNQKSRDAVSVYADVPYFTEGITKKQDIAGSMMRELIFPEPAKVDIDFDEQNISLHTLISWSSEQEEVTRILGRKSTLPAVLSRLPESAVYCTLLNLGDPEFLYANTQPFFSKELLSLFATAEKNSKLFFGKDLNRLIFEWIGSEIGVFGHKDAQSPVFFVSVKDENRCRRVLDDLFDTIFLDRNTSAVVDGKRIPRIVFPSWLSALLRAFGIDLPQPFYMIQDGYLYLSKSAEVLGMCKQEADQGKLLIKTDVWKHFSKKMTPETSLLVYYTLGRSMPFFLEHNVMLKTALKNYGKGVLSLRFGNDNRAYLDLHTQKTESNKWEEIPGFPRSFADHPDTDIICARTAGNVPFVFWTHDTAVYSMNLQTGAIVSLALDAKAGITAEINRSKLHALWAVSARGTVYKTNEHLDALPGFPVLTAEKMQQKPVVFNGGIAVPLFSAPALLYMDSKGAWFISDEMEAKLRTAPIPLKNELAALPRSFESRFYLFNREGKITDGFPFELEGIFASSPLIFTDEAGGECAAFLSEDGIFSIYALTGDRSQKAALELQTVCKADPVYSARAKAFFAVSTDGNLFKISQTGELIDSLPLKIGKADDYRLTVLDLQADGKDEILVSGGGNALYAYTAELAAVDGFPVAGTGTPYLLDIDGDGRCELVTYGIDTTFHAYKGAASQ